jgi:hypothetical protein
MDAARGGARRPAPSGTVADQQRRAAAQQAMARMEEMMLAHAGAAGEFSIILEAPLPSLQQYRRHPAPSSGASSSASSSSPCRRGGRVEERVPARLRRDGSGSGHDALADAGAGAAARPSRRGADAGARREQRPAGGARGVVRGEEAAAEEEVEAPVRLTGPRSVRRPVSRGATPPPRASETKRAVVEKEEEEEGTPLQLLARGGRSSSATRPTEAPPPPSQSVETIAAAARPSSRRSRQEVGVRPVAAEVASSVDSDVESVGRWSSRGSEDGVEEAVALPRPVAAVVARDRSRSNSPAISNVNDDTLRFMCFAIRLKQPRVLIQQRKKQLGKNDSNCFAVRRLCLIHCFETSRIRKCLF